MIFYFKWLPDWSGGFKITYSMQTALSQNERYVEQRASFRDFPLRRIAFQNMEVENASELHHFLLKRIQEAIYVPIFSEPMLAESATDPAPLPAYAIMKREGQGYNAKRLAGRFDAIAIDLLTETDFLLSMTYDGTDVKMTADVTGNEMTAARMAAQTTIYFPAIRAYLDQDFKKSSQGSAVHTFDLVFNEAV